jgi:hypothetical protein
MKICLCSVHADLEAFEVGNQHVLSAFGGRNSTIIYFIFIEFS